MMKDSYVANEATWLPLQFAVVLLACISFIPLSQSRSPPPYLENCITLSASSVLPEKIKLFNRSLAVSEVFIEAKLPEGWVTYGFATFIAHKSFLITLRNPRFDKFQRRIRFGEFDPFTVKIVRVQIKQHIFEKLFVLRDGGVLGTCNVYRRRVFGQIFFFEVEIFDEDEYIMPTTGIIESAAGELEQYSVLVPLIADIVPNYVYVESQYLGNKSIAFGKALLSTSGVLLGCYAYQTGPYLSFHKVEFGKI